ncbi:hypothetical protein AWB89_05225 [Mycobacterium paraense]|nr:hypothetical protein AWB89_05225 [Mycobacterium paraense]
MSWPSFEHHFASARLVHYLGECSGDHQRAMELYEWNTAVSAAFWESLGYLEVALRNALDRQMQALHLSKGRPSHWIFDDARELGRDAQGAGKHNYPYQHVATAISRVRQNKKRVTPGQIISEISFGFWHQLVSKRQVRIWPNLVAAFPFSPNRSQATVHDPISRLRTVRNRIGHHHRIWSLDMAAHYADILTVAGYIDPELAAWIDGCSRFHGTLAKRP